MCLWRSTWHSAVWAHGLTMQGLIHWRFKQAWFVEQSESEEQKLSIDLSTKNLIKVIWYPHHYKVKSKFLLQNSPWTQDTVASPTKSEGHSQIIVLIGKVSITEHLALAIQGLDSSQGFLQTLLKHANLLGQSASTLHSENPISSLVHSWYGFPTNPGGQQQVGSWSTTTHCDDSGQLHGLTHLLLWHAKS